MGERVYVSFLQLGVWEEEANEVWVDVTHDEWLWDQGEEIPLSQQQEGFLGSSGQKLVQIEPVVNNLVHFGQEESGHLPGCGDRGYQPEFQVVERLGLLVPAQGPLV